MNYEILLDKENLISNKATERDVHLIKTILEMPEWENPKFKGLLTSNIWQSNTKDIKEILNMEEWEDPIYEGLLTPNIWKSNPRDIKIILSMKEFQTDEYKHLLCPSIFNVSFKNIIPTIKLLEEYGIGKYITNRCLRRNVDLQRELLEYMININIDLVVEKSDGSYTLNPIINASNTDARKKYGIDIKNLNVKGVIR